MRIGELAQATGADVETIRYYEKIGLLPPPGRAANGYRAYGSEQVERLAFIRHCRALDMPLAQIGRLLDFVARPQADCGDINALIDEQLERVRGRLASLQALERQLVALRASCQGSHRADECGILHELAAAAHGDPCTCHGDGRAATDADRVAMALPAASPRRTVSRHGLPDIFDEIITRT